MICGSARTVWLRLPPESCSMMIAPRPVLAARAAPVVALLTIAATPGRDQSRVSTVATTIRYPYLAARPYALQSAAVIDFGPPLYGGRRSRVLIPAAPASAFWVSVSSSGSRQPADTRFTCV